MSGIEVRPKADGSGSVYVNYRAHGRILRDLVGYIPAEEMTTNRRRLWAHPVVAEARRAKKQRQEVVRDATATGAVVHSKAEVKRLASEANRTKVKGKEDLLYENVMERFLTKHERSYAAPSEVRNRYENRMGTALNGVYLDDLRKSDIHSYIEDRFNRAGPFAEWPRKVGIRTVQQEVAALSTLFSFLIEEEERGDLTNPCTRIWKQRKNRQRGRKGGVPVTYKPLRKKPSVSKAAVEALLAAAPCARHKAVFTVMAKQGARPSEACGLHHGDVTLSDPKVKNLDGSSASGRIRFVETKTGVDRELPLHPDAEEALEAVMLKVPDDPDEYENWAQTPIFTKRRSSESWDRGSYRDGWEEMRDAARKKFPEVQRMVPYDLRTWANNQWKEAGLNDTMAAQSLGNTVAVNARHYTSVTTTVAQRAIQAL